MPAARTLPAFVRPWLAGVLASLLAAGGLAALLSTPGGESIRLDLLISPHPDDELLAWAALEDDPQTYTVVVALTRGEQTRNCDRIDEDTQEDAGERLPEPVPETRGGGDCAAARINSWNTFLNQAAEVMPEVALGGAERHDLDDERFGGDAVAWVGSNSARVSVGLPDGGLSRENVVAAVEGLLEERGALLPDLPLRRIVAASYWNDSAEHGSRTQASGDCSTAGDCPGNPTAFEYENADHRETTAAMSTLAGSASLGAWVAVPPGESEELTAALGAPPDPAWRHLALTSEVYDRFMGLGPTTEDGPRRLGIQQVVYGWLAFPGQWWDVGDEPGADTDVLFPRRQTFLVLPGATR